MTGHAQLGTLGCDTTALAEPIRMTAECDDAVAQSQVVHRLQVLLADIESRVLQLVQTEHRLATSTHVALPNQADTHNNSTTTTNRTTQATTSSSSAAAEDHIKNSDNNNTETPWLACSEAVCKAPHRSLPPLDALLALPGLRLRTRGATAAAALNEARSRRKRTIVGLTTARVMDKLTRLRQRYGLDLMHTSATVCCDSTRDGFTSTRPLQRREADPNTPATQPRAAAAAAVVYGDNTNEKSDAAVTSRDACQEESHPFAWAEAVWGIAEEGEEENSASGVPALPRVLVGSSGGAGRVEEDASQRQTVNVEAVCKKNDSSNKDDNAAAFVQLYSTLQSHGEADLGLVEQKLRDVIRRVESVVTESGVGHAAVTRWLRTPTQWADSAAHVHDDVRRTETLCDAHARVCDYREQLQRLLCRWKAVRESYVTRVREVNVRLAQAAMQLEEMEERVSR